MVIELDGRGLEKPLRTGEVDLVVDERDDDQPEPSGRGIAVHLLRRDPYRVVALPAVARTLHGPRSLAGVRWVASPANTACDFPLQRLARLGRFEPDVAHICSYFPSILALVMAGEGVSIIPELALGDARGVEACSIAGLGARKLFAIQRTSRRGTEPAVDAAVNALRHGPRAPLA
jgi:DNA-binding transcriptional LysR family regulator